MMDLVKLLLCSVLLPWLVFTDQDSSICCLPDQYEATLMGYIGVASSHGGHGFHNGTARIAYDWINNKTYFYEVTSSMKSVLPFPTGLNITAIFDYNLDEKFIIFRDGTCHSEEIGYQLFKQCIPGNATYLGEGIFYGLPLYHYRFTEDIYDSEYEITMSVIMSEDKENVTLCTPIHVVQSHMYPVNETNLDLTGGDVFEFNPAIKDPTIFKPPGACISRSKQRHRVPDVPKRPASLFNLWTLHGDQD